MPSSVAGRQGSALAARDTDEWRLLDTPPAAGRWNMALDEALMDSVRGGSPPVLRFYRWSPPCLSLGRNQPAAGEYDLEAVRGMGIDVVRRLTGGRAVLHHRELTYSACFQHGALGSPREAYAALNRGLAGGLRLLGVPAELGAGPDRPSPLSLEPCFREPGKGEVVAGGRKLIGSAQYRERGVTLQHGSLLFADDQAAIPRLLAGTRPKDSIDQPAVLQDFLDPLPPWGMLVDALVKGLTDIIGSAPLLADVLPDEVARAASLAARYADPAWTWRL